MSKMDPELKAKWVAALRSGEYKQGQGRLLRKTENGDEFCCLGVLCEVAGVSRTGAGYGGAFNAPENLLTIEDQAPLIDMNDGLHGCYRGDDSGVIRFVPPAERKSFAEIAEWIEAHL